MIDFDEAYNTHYFLYWHNESSEDYTIFLSGFFKRFPGMTAIVDCLYLPIVVFISFVFLDEILGIKGLFGATLVFIAIFVGSASKNYSHRNRLFYWYYTGDFRNIAYCRKHRNGKKAAGRYQCPVGFICKGNGGHSGTLSRSPVKPSQEKTAGRALPVKSMVFRPACISCR